MELLTAYRDQYNSIVEKYYFESNQTEKYWARDNLAALKVQSKYRMYVKRKEFLKMKSAAIKIQTAYRAHYARKMYKKRAKSQFDRRCHEFFSQQATIIQKMYKGFYTRKYVINGNFYKRKEQLLALKKKNEEFKKELDKYAIEQAEEEKIRRQELARAQFTELARNLHHLSSTQAIPGVYNSPFAINKPSAFNIPVQSHLKDVFNKSYRWKAPTRKDILKHTLPKN